MPIPDLFATHGTSVTIGSEVSGHHVDAGTVPSVLIQTTECMAEKVVLLGHSSLTIEPLKMDV